MIRRKHEKVCTTLTYIEHFLISASAISGCISIHFNTFASFLSIPTGILKSVFAIYWRDTTASTGNVHRKIIRT